ACELTEPLQDRVRLYVDHVEIEIGVQAHDLEYRLLRATRLSWRYGVDAEECTAIRSVPSVQDQLVETSAVAAPANLGGASAVAVVKKAAKINAAGRGTKKVGNEGAGRHGDYPKEVRPQLWAPLAQMRRSGRPLTP